MDVPVLFMITGVQQENLIQEPSNVSLWAILPQKKGYRCWSPTERKFFVSMDVTFHEKEPFYSLKGNDNGTGNKGENIIGESNDRGTVIIPIGDIIRSEDEIEGEETTNTNVEGDNTLISEAYENLSGQEEMETKDGEGVPQEVDEEVVNQSQVLEEAPTSEEMAHDEGDVEGTETHIPSSSTQINDEPIAL